MIGSLHLTPNGRLALAEDDTVEGDAQARRIAAAFARGAGHGLLQLGLDELGSELPPELAYFRELARGFLTAACARPELETLRDKIDVTPPEGALERLYDAAPPMLGSEYLTTAVLAQLWSETQAALRVELREIKGSVQAYLHARSPAWNLVGRVCFHLAENR
ncbi:MAG TPA: ATP-dependent helicase, partial [Polyangia bacterium]